MQTRTSAGRDQSTADRPDAQYALVAGLYVAALLAPVAVLALSRSTSDGGMLYIGFLAAVTLFTSLAGWGVSRIPGLAVSLGERDTTWLLVVVPFAWFVGVFGAVASGFDPPGVAAPLAVVSSAGGMLAGLILVAMSRNRHAAAAVDGVPELAAWEARWPRWWRHASLGIAGLTLVAWVIGLVAEYGFGVDEAGALYFLMLVWIPLAGTNPRTFRVTETGLVVEYPLQHRFRPWSAYDGYELTDDALVVHHSAWWRPAHRCDRADVEDIGAATGALDTVLAPRNGTSGSP